MPIIKPTKPTPDELAEFQVLLKSPIDAYTDEGAFRKDRFRRIGAKILGEIAHLMGLLPNQYEVRWNPAGIAGSGDLILHTQAIYVNFEANVCLSLGFMYRGCDGMRDYGGGGGRNCWMSWRALERDLQRVADAMTKEASAHKARKADRS